MELESDDAARCPALLLPSLSGLASSSALPLEGGNLAPDGSATSPLRDRCVPRLELLARLYLPPTATLPEQVTWHSTIGRCSPLHLLASLPGSTGRPQKGRSFAIPCAVPGNKERVIVPCAGIPLFLMVQDRVLPPSDVPGGVGTQRGVGAQTLD